MPDETIETPETAEVQGGVDQNTETFEDTATTDQGAIQGQEATPKEPESFINPSELPDELKPHWKRMHRAYTKRLEEIKGVRDRADMAERFANDDQFALQTLSQWAAQRGYAISPVGTAAQAQQQQQPQRQGPAAPPQLVEAVRSQLAPELQWMAENLANAQWAAQQMLYAPVLQQQQQYQRQNALAEYDRAAQELTHVAPGWEAQEDQMDKLLQFLQGPSIFHPDFGNKVSLLYNVVNGNAAAVRQTVNRMNQAVKNRSGASGGGARPVSNLTDRIRKAPTTNDAWAMATQAALNKVPLEDEV